MYFCAGGELYDAEFPYTMSQFQLTASVRRREVMFYAFGNKYYFNV